MLGAKALADPALADPKTIFVTFAGKVFPGVGGEVLNWIIAFMLIVALALSALNAIMGSGRALYQMAVDGEFPTWFSKVNEHGVPARAMAFNVVASLIVVLAGRRRGDLQLLQRRLHGVLPAGADRLLPAAPGQAQPPATVQAAGVHEVRALSISRRSTSSSGSSAACGTRSSAMSRSTYWLGWATLLAYLPLYWYRVYVEDKRSPAVEAKRKPA